MKRVKWPFGPRTIAGVEALPGMRLRVTWADGAASVVDLTDWTRGFSALNDPALFASARVDSYGSAVEWIEDELAIDSIHLQLLESEQHGVPLLPDALRRWREQAGLSQAQAAEALGVSRRMLQNYEAGDGFIPLTVAMACKGWSALHGEKAA